MKPLHSFLPPEEILAANISLDTSIAAVVQNSQTVTPAAAYFALRGSQADGHSFCAAALAKGAAVVIVEQPEVYAAHPRAVLVRSTRKALGLAAAAWFDHPTRSLRLVGVTGTNGKTTTTYLLHQVWEALGIRSGLIGTVASLWGEHREPSRLTTPAPLELQATLRRMASDGVTQVAMEVTSIALDQYRVAGSRFEVGLFTNFTQDHLDYHGDFETYYRAKQRLFEEYSIACGVFNTDDPTGRRLRREASGARATLGFGFAGGDFRVREARFGKSGTEAAVDTPAGVVNLITPLVGKHNLYNCLGVLAAAHALGHDPREVVAALKAAPGAPGRFERVVLGADLPHVFVDYAHSDDALEKVLLFLRELRGEGAGRIITVFGCGGDRDRGKRPLMGKVASSWSDITIATSDNPRTEAPAQIIDDIEPGIRRDVTRYHREENRRQAIYLALSLAQPDDLVLVAGKGHETYQILATGQIPFDDRAVIREYYCNSALKNDSKPRPLPAE